jgi:AraC-like DNA-binding protein
MSIGEQILFSVSALGAFNGFVLSLYLFSRKKTQSKASFFLAILLLALSIRVGKSVFLYFNPKLPKIYLQVGLSACFLIGPGLYYFFKSALLKVTQIPASWKWIWGIYAGIIVVGGIIVPYQVYPKIWNNIVVYIIYGQWMLYVAATGFLLGPVIKSFFKNASHLKAVEKFWLLVFVGNCAIFILYLLSLLQVHCGMYISGGVSFSLILYLTIIFYMYGAKVENLLTPQETEQPNRPEKRKIAESDAQVWIEKLEKAITRQQLYKDPNLKLNDLAKKVNISAHQLSQLLNDNLGKSFSTYVNEYRINEACKLITTDSHLTLEAIGYEVGFNSKSTFYTAFKKIKDTTPALFKESIEKIASK